MKILHLTQLLPFPPRTGGLLKTYKILSMLSRMGEVWSLSFFDQLGKKPQIIELARKLDIRVESIYRPEVTAQKEKLYKIISQSLVSPKPFRVLTYFDPRMTVRINQLLAKNHFDAIYLDHETSWQYLKTVRLKEDVRVIFDEHNLNSVASRRTISEKGRGVKVRSFACLDAVKYYWLEREIALKADRMLSISRLDRELLINQGADPQKIKFLPVPFEANKIFKFKEESPRIILFVGLLSWAPNKYGLHWFYKKIWPKISVNPAKVKLWVVGDRLEDDTRRLMEQDKRIKFWGEVAEVKDFYRQAAVVIAPLLTGSGVKMKVLEAMAYGMPIVGTRIAVEGIDDSGETVMLANDPVSFADAIETLLSNKVKALQISENAFSFINRYYQEKIAREVLSWAVNG